MPAEVRREMEDPGEGRDLCTVPCPRRRLALPETRRGHQWAGLEGKSPTAGGSPGSPKCVDGAVSREQGRAQGVYREELKRLVCSK